MTPVRILLVLVQAHNGHPHYVALEEVTRKLLDDVLLTADDIGALIQGFVGHPILDSLDLIELLDWINVKYGTRWGIHGNNA